MSITESIAATTLFAVLIAAGLSRYYDHPRVEIDPVTQECIDVWVPSRMLLDEGPGYDCNHLPNNYVEVYTGDWK